MVLLVRSNFPNKEVVIKMVYLRRAAENISCCCFGARSDLEMLRLRRLRCCSADPLLLGVRFHIKEHLSHECKFSPICSGLLSIKHSWCFISGMRPKHPKRVEIMEIIHRLQGDPGPLLPAGSHQSNGTFMLKAFVERFVSSPREDQFNFGLDE